MMPIDPDEFEQGITDHMKDKYGIPRDEDVKCYPNLTIVVREDDTLEFYRDGEKVYPLFLVGADVDEYASVCPECGALSFFESGVRIYCPSCDTVVETVEDD